MLWRLKRFDSLAARDAWIAKRGHRIQWGVVFIANCPAAIEWRKLRRVL